MNGNPVCILCAIAAMVGTFAIKRNADKSQVLAL